MSMRPKPEIIALVSLKMARQSKEMSSTAVYMHWLKVLTRLFSEQKIGATLPWYTITEQLRVAQRIAKLTKALPTGERFLEGIEKECLAGKCLFKHVVDVINSQGFKTELAPITSAQLRALGLKKLR